MRYVLVAIFVCAVGAPAASALPAVSPDSLSLSKTGAIEQAAAKKARPRAHRQSRGSSAGGIHPLVGSGDY
jgi:hypothetical protein